MYYNNCELKFNLQKLKLYNRLLLHLLGQIFQFRKLICWLPSQQLWPNGFAEIRCSSHPPQISLSASPVTPQSAPEDILGSPNEETLCSITTSQMGMGVVIVSTRTTREMPGERAKEEDRRVWEGCGHCLI